MASDPSVPWAAYVALPVLIAGAVAWTVRGYRNAKMQQKRLVAGLAVAATPGAIGAIVVQRQGEAGGDQGHQEAEGIRQWLNSRDAIAEHWFITGPKK